MVEIESQEKKRRIYRFIFFFTKKKNLFEERTRKAASQLIQCFHCYLTAKGIFRKPPFFSLLFTLQNSC